MRFSRLAEHFDHPQNRLYAAKARLERLKRPVRDLISGNVSALGLTYPPALLAKALDKGHRAARQYRPDPLGQAVARRAVAAWYGREGLKLDADQVLLTPGSSLAYWYAFKLLADPRDEILAPRPTYPLFDSIAAMAGVKLVPYYLRSSRYSRLPGERRGPTIQTSVVGPGFRREDVRGPEQLARWAIDLESIEAAITERTRAVLLVSPHNPTGAVATPEELAALSQIARRHNLAIISDEVFSPFLYMRDRLPRAAETDAPLVLTLNGLSKMLALPGMKLGWMLLTGDPEVVTKARKTLEMLSDTFLPVNEMAQFALPGLLGKSARFVARIVETMRFRRELARKALAGLEATCPEPEGGFYWTLDLSRFGMEEDAFAVRLLEEHRMLVHPGYFYDLEGSHLIFTFAARPAELRQGLRAITAALTRSRGAGF
jgi:alanine-synthesizing transaminase